MAVLDVAKLKSTSRKDLITLARILENSERFADMCQVMRRALATGPADISQDERSLLSIAYKNVVGAHRNSWRTLCSMLESEEPGPVREDLDALRALVEGELSAACNELLALLEEAVLPACAEKDVEYAVFFHKMAADYHRYLAEARQSNGARAVEFYAKAFEKAKELPKTHPTRLGLVLNYTVCIYEIQKNPEVACSMAHSAFEEALQELDSMPEEEYKDSTLIMQLLRDNITLWKSDSEVSAAGAKGADDEDAPRASDEPRDDEDDALEEERPMRDE